MKVEKVNVQWQKKTSTKEILLNNNKDTLQVMIIIALLLLPKAHAKGTSKCKYFHGRPAMSSSGIAIDTTVLHR